MHRISLIVALSCLSIVGLGCQSSAHHTDSAPAAGDVATQVNALVEKHCEAQRRKDTAVFETLWADDFIFINPRGQVLTKAQRIENITTGATSFKSLACNEISTQSSGHDWAVTTCRAILEGQYSGQEGSGDYRCTFVWAKRDARWQLVSLQMTSIAR